ncbi:MAG: alpha-2-macroglobulin family protein, partial [Myxococcota bacterium]
DVGIKDRTPRPSGFHSYELISPKGATVLSKRVRANEGPPANDFEIPEGVPGGEYKIRVRTANGASTERPIVVSNYEAPRIKKKLEFMRKAYGAGDTVKATLELKRPTGAPLANHPIRPVGSLEGRPLEIANLKTNARGEATVVFSLPKTINVADGLLTIMVEDGGVTESISKRIPIVLKKIQMGFFPEGGTLVEGVESRLYFEAKNSVGKPADVSGKIVDDLGNAVAEFSTYHKGVGRLTFQPASGRRYSAKLTQPAGVSESYALPIPEQEGCVLRTYDDLDGELSALRARVVCSEEQDVWVVGTMGDSVFDTAKVKAGPEGAVVYLNPKGADTKRRGIARVTVFAEGNVPMAERIVFRNRRAGLDISISMDESRYAPRDQVELSLTTKNATGEPVAAELAVSIVDDTVISFADDKTGHLTSSLLFESEIPGKVEEPKFFLDLTEEKSAMALELLMGTRGYRRFNWSPVFEPPMPEMSMIGFGRAGGGAPEDGMAMPKGAAIERRRERRPVPAAAPPPAKALAAPAPVMAEAKPEPKPLENIARQAQKVAEAEPMMDMEMDDIAEILEEPPPVGGKRDAMRADKDWAGAELFAKKKRKKAQFAPVREFPLPSYTGEVTGVRSDFRETIYWSPRISTDTQGKAKVRFFLSDAVTSFRIFAEGSGGNALGRKEKTFESSLPFSLNVKLPLEVSAGDEPRIPLTLTNERAENAQVSLSASFGDLLKLNESVSPPDGLGAKERASLFYPVTVNGTRGLSEVRISAASNGLTDEVVRPVKVVPKGFPRIVATSGTVRKTSDNAIQLNGAIPNTAKAQVTVYPSITATLLSGLDGILREPYGCFEQTSSSNYPNVLVMDYLQSSGQGDPAVLARAGSLLDKGYKRLVSFETKEKGYEWFGGAPAHEALTAYGVLEFTDMKRVYGGVDDEMLTRTIKYLERRRDGQGGFKRDSKALDSFGRADPEITNAYITYAVTEAGHGDRFAKEVGALASAA